MSALSLTARAHDYVRAAGNGATADDMAL